MTGLSRHAALLVSLAAGVAGVSWQRAVWHADNIAAVAVCRAGEYAMRHRNRK